MFILIDDRGVPLLTSSDPRFAPSLLVWDDEAAARKFLAIAMSSPLEFATLYGRSPVNLSVRPLDCTLQEATHKWALRGFAKNPRISPAAPSD